MNRSWRSGALAAGLLALALGLGAMFAPGLLGFGLGVELVSLFGLLTVLLAARAVQLRRENGRLLATTADPEVLRPSPPPGDDMDETLADFLGASRTYYGRFGRRALREAALDALTHARGIDRAAATELLDAGTWTDDAQAAAFLQEDPPAAPVTGRVRRILGLESVRQRRRRRTIDAIAAVAGVDADAPDRSLLGGVRRRLGRGEGRPGGRAARGTDSIGEVGGGTVRRETGYWQGISLVALLGVGVGLLVEQPALLLVGAVGIGYAAYARTATDPDVALALERSLSEPSPAPGDDVEVSVTVTNEGEATIPDLRLVDGVPPGLAVTEGSPRLGTLLRPGETTTLSYTVTARRGSHAFGSVHAIVRDLTGGREVERRLDAPTVLTCLPRPQSFAAAVPLREQAARHAGQVRTTVGGEGIEFHATREYRRGDPLGRIDWNRRAKTGDLATLQFREERGATVVVLVDTRDRAFVAPEAHEENAADRSVDAAGQTFETLLDAGNRAGLAAVGNASAWLSPSTGPEHRTRARKLLGTHPGFGPTPAETDGLRRWNREFRRRLPTGTQVVFFTPLCDPAGVSVARTLEAHGYPVTVVTPDPTTSRTPGHLLARVGRRLRVSELRSAGIPVVEWAWDTPVETALARHAEGSR